MSMISIITVNYNDANGLEETIKSVMAQTYRDYEHIVVDGDSSDGSKEIIDKYRDKLSWAVSEPDNGIYHAMNKGIRASKGKYLLFLNSGDTLYNENVLDKTVEKLKPDHRIYYGDVLRIFENGTSKIKTYPNELSFGFFVDSALAHQSVFIDRTLFDEISFYDESYKVLADWELLIRAICVHHIPYKHMGIIVARYDMTGISSQPEGKKIMLEERNRCYHEHFRLFWKDYRELMNYRLIFRSKQGRLFNKIEQKKVSRTLNYWFMKLLSKFI